MSAHEPNRGSISVVGERREPAICRTRETAAGRARRRTARELGPSRRSAMRRNASAEGIRVRQQLRTDVASRAPPFRAERGRPASDGKRGADGHHERFARWSSEPPIWLWMYPKPDAVSASANASWPPAPSCPKLAGPRSGRTGGESSTNPVPHRCAAIRPPEACGRTTHDERVVDRADVITAADPTIGDAGRVQPCQAVGGGDAVGARDLGRLDAGSLNVTTVLSAGKAKRRRWWLPARTIGRARQRRRSPRASGVSGSGGGGSIQATSRSTVCGGRSRSRAERVGDALPRNAPGVSPVIRWMTSPTSQPYVIAWYE